MKLLEHFKAMQGMASRYLEPKDYVDREGVTHIADDPAYRTQAFASDMVYMLDGPEQRVAQTSAEISDSVLRSEIHQNQLLGIQFARMRAAMQEFVDRVDKGEVRSKRTYAKFKDILGSYPAPEDPMKTLLRTMFEGWILREKEGDVPDRFEEDCMIEACGGDKLKGNLLCLFSHWSNDILGIAAHYGLTLARKQPDGSIVHNDGTLDTMLLGGEPVIVDVPPAPSPEHYWYEGEWKAPEQDPEGVELG